MAAFDANIRLLVEAKDALREIKKLENRLASLEATATGKRTAAQVRNLIRTEEAGVQTAQRRLEKEIALASATQLYARRKQQLERAGGATNKELRAQVAAVQKLVDLSGDNVGVMQRSATLIGRILERQRELNRAQREQDARASRITTEYRQRIERLRAIGIENSKLNKILESRKALIDANSRRQTDAAKAEEERLKRLLASQERLNKEVLKPTRQLASPIGGTKNIPGSPAFLAEADRLRDIESNLFEKAAAAQIKARKKVADLEKQYTRENRQRAFDALQEEFNAKMAALKKVDDIKKQQFDAEIEAFDKALAAREQINKAASEGIQTRKDVEDKIARIQRDYQQELGEIKSRQRLEDLKERQKIEDKIFSDKIRKAEQEGREFDKELKRRSKAREQASQERARRRRQFGEDLALGAGFPLLTGAGPGGVLGGVAGAIAGGGGGGFGLQILFSALGSLVDQAVGSIVRKAAELGTALNPLTLNIDALVRASGKASTAVGKLLNSLKGQISDSRLAQLAAEQLAVTIGDNGVAALREFGEASNDLGRELSKAFSAIAASIAPLLTASIRPLGEFAERRRLVSRAAEFAAEDPEIAKLERQRRATAGASSIDQEKIEAKLIELVKQRELVEQRLADARLSGISNKTQEIALVELENSLKATSRDLTDDSVAALEERILRQQSSNEAYKIGVSFANDEITLAEYINQLRLNRLRLDGRLLDLANQINKAEQQKEERERREAERAEQKAKRKQKEIERALRATEVLKIEANLAETILGIDKEILTAKTSNNKKELQALQLSKEFAQLDATRAKINNEDISNQDKRLKIRIAEATAQGRINEINAAFADEERKQNEEKAKALIAVERSLNNQINLIDAKMNGNKEELEIIQEVNSLTEGIKNISVEEAEAIERQVRALRERLKLEEAFDIEQQTRFAGAGLQAGFIGQAGRAFEQKLISGGTRQEAANIAQLTQQMELAQLQATALQDAVLGIGNAFATAMTTGVSELIAGTKSAEEVFADFLKSVGDALVSAAARMIATYIAIGIAKAFAGLSGGGNPNPDGLQLDEIGKYMSQRATGGPVERNRAYMVGEQGPELFTPNQAGRISSANETRSLLGRSPVGGAPAMNFTFETTNIGGQEYVSREQLEAAMAVTRKQAANDGASKGMSMTLDKMQHSPATRRRVGIG